MSLYICLCGAKLLNHYPNQIKKHKQTKKHFQGIHETMMKNLYLEEELQQRIIEKELNIKPEITVFFE
tara:strand:+ start:224 stop:427 length:204 start_codon:yes stop_codon:yes gene_type:complete